MRITATLLALTCFTAASSPAQAKQSVEIGTSLGVTLYSGSGPSATVIGVPGLPGPAVV